MTWHGLKAAMLESLRMNCSVVLVMVAYIAAAIVLGWITGFDLTLRIYSMTLALWLFLSFWIVLVPIVLLQLYRHRPANPIGFTRHLLVKDLQIVERGIAALPCVLLFPVFGSAFTSVKSAIGNIHPYSLDPLFAGLDKFIHGGHAWELIHPLVGSPWLTYGIDYAYKLWFVAVWITFSLVLVMIGDRQLREQYLLSFMGCWVLLGSVAAIGLSSVGPVYYGLVYSTDPYAPLMSYLRSVDSLYPLTAVASQDMLWQSYSSKMLNLGSGISAMPSLHVGIAALNAIFLSKLSRTAGALAWVYVVVILIGSVHLGWHYAIDGYVAIIGALVIWQAAGWWARRSLEPAPAAGAI